MAFRVPLARSLAGRICRPAASSSSAAAHAPTSTAASRLLLRQGRLYSSAPPPPQPPPPPPPPPPRRDRVKFWPFAVVVALGTGGYIALVNRRKDMPPAIDAPKTAGQLSAPDKPTPTFSPDDVTVVFVLGGPGAGKGTQCERLVAEHGFTHLSAGDLLRAEQDRPGSQFGDLIRDYIKNGLIVPMEVTVQLLENAMTDAMQRSGSKRGRFLIDGFPRKLDQAHKFEDAVCPARMVLFFDCPEDVMQRRLLERGKTSGRSDDNAESIRKRFRTFVETSMPVVDYYDKSGKVVKVDATPTPDKVFATTKKLLTAKLGSDF